MEGIRNVMNRILSTSACDDDITGYNCPDCNKWIDAIIVKLEFLNVERKVLPACECAVRKQEEFLREAANHAKRMEIERLFSISNLGERFAASNFASFLKREGSTTAFDMAVRYTENFKDWGGDSLMIWGEPGNGKTHLSSAITNELNRKGYAVVFQSVPELLRRIKSTFNKESKETENQVMKALLTCDLLVLDDIGAEKATDWVEETLYAIIDGRYRVKAPILYTSNLQPKELHEQVGKRSYDRMVETSLTVENKATSYRREIAKERLKRLGDL